MNRMRTLFVIDTAIAVALLLAAASAIAFLVPFSAIDFATASAEATFLGLGYGFWRTAHLYSGLVMITGGLMHFGMHWGWMIKTAKAMQRDAGSRDGGARPATDAMTDVA
jgi:uncharacterized membrane protein